MFSTRMLSGARLSLASVARSRIGAVAGVSASRSLTVYHELPPLSFKEETGAPTLSSNAYKHYLSVLQSNLTRVNELLDSPKREDLRELPLYALITRTARTPEHAHLFNHASQSWNMHYALACQSATKQEPSERVLRRINYEFMSLENLKREFINCAMSMFGSGTVWLVEDEKLTLRIICCFNGGTPLAPARLHLVDKNLLPESPSSTDVRDATLFQSMAVQGSDPSPEALASDALASSTNRLEEARKDLLVTLDTLLEGRRKPDAGARSDSLVDDATAAASAPSTWPKTATQFDALMHRPPFGLPLVPILACSVWEHAYMLDYGTDRKKYLEDWWNSINWEHVHHYMGADEWEPETAAGAAAAAGGESSGEQDAFKRFLEHPQGQPASGAELRTDKLLSGLKNRKARPSQMQLAADLAAALKMDIGSQTK